MREKAASLCGDDRAAVLKRRTRWRRRRKHEKGRLAGALVVSFRQPLATRSGARKFIQASFASGMHAGLAYFCLFRIHFAFSFFCLKVKLSRNGGVNRRYWRIIEHLSPQLTQRGGDGGTGDELQIKFKHRTVIARVVFAKA